MTLKLKIEYASFEPVSPKSIYAMTEYVKKSSIEESLRDLIYIRASQINGCAFCLDMHTQDAIAHGVPPQKAVCVSVWRESPFFSNRERAALEFTETMTRIAQAPLSEDTYGRIREEFNEHEYVALVMAINIINCWNRLMIACGGTAGMYSNKELKEGSPGYFGIPVS